MQMTGPWQAMNFREIPGYYGMSAKNSVTLRIDHDVLEWFKEKGRGYQTRMNAVLKAYVKAHQ